MKPRLGEIVNYVLRDGVIRPAIITRVWNDGSAVNLIVFYDGPDDKRADNEMIVGDNVSAWKTSVCYAEPKEDDVEFQANTWFFQ